MTILSGTILPFNCTARIEHRFQIRHSSKSYILLTMEIDSYAGHETSQPGGLMSRHLSIIDKLLRTHGNQLKRLILSIWLFCIVNWQLVSYTDSVAFHDNGSCEKTVVAAIVIHSDLFNIPNSVNLVLSWNIWRKL